MLPNMLNILLVGSSNIRLRRPHWTSPSHRAKSCDVKVSFLFLARIAAVTAPDIISAFSQRTAIFVQAISTGTISSCTPNSCRNLSRTQFSACILPQQEPILALLLYPASPRAALSQVALVSRSLPTVYQLTHSIPCYDRSSGIKRGRCRISDFTSEMLSLYKCCAQPMLDSCLLIPFKIPGAIAQLTHSRTQ